MPKIQDNRYPDPNDWESWMWDEDEYERVAASDCEEEMKYLEAQKKEFDNTLNNPNTGGDKQ